MIKQLFKIPLLKIQKIEIYESVNRIYASIRSTRSRCPLCGKYSNRVHDYYFRTISDLPIFQSKTIILLKTRKFKCVNKQCQRKVFSEQTPAILRYSRRTERAEKLLDTLAIELTGRLGSILSKQLNLYVSSSTMTRIAHNLPLPDIVRPKVLGVDDWAYRKGVSYGTVLIDKETSRPIDLLPSRDGKVLKESLLNNNDVKIVSRDRASSYAAAIIEACPGTIKLRIGFIY
jgi:transposase